jgi:quercetin dioxygenase-like cupin family protein
MHTNRAAIQVEFKRTADFSNTFTYMGSLMSFLVEGEETNRQFAHMEYRAKPSNEPPPHIHEWEDETLYILEGEVEVYQSNAVLRLAPGDCLLTPKGTPHAWYILTPTVRILGMVVPAHIDLYFKEMMSLPTESMELPAGPVTYAMEDPQRAISLGRKHGCRFLSPEETKQALPKYPGFGIPRT